MRDDNLQGPIDFAFYACGLITIVWGALQAFVKRLNEEREEIINLVWRTLIYIGFMVSGFILLYNYSDGKSNKLFGFILIFIIVNTAFNAIAYKNFNDK